MSAEPGRPQTAASLPRRLPWATYRLQFNHRFTFRDAAAVVPYLRRLGITDCYASPYFKARPGSLHGYDVSDHNRLNPEVGSEADYDAFVAVLATNGLGQILDIIPNHMGVGEAGNVWWMDVLTHGPGSYFARVFDVDWSPIKVALRDRLLLPILGDQYGIVLERGELTVVYDRGAFYVRYHDFQLPIDPRSATAILELDVGRLDAEPGPEHPDVMELRSISTALRNLPGQRDADVEKYRERRRETEVVRRRLERLRDGAPAVRQFLDENIRIFNGQKGDLKSFDRLDALLERQAYRLAYWRVAAEEINYRRFFDENQLAAIRVEDPVVFEETHRLVGRLLAEGKVTGLRVDHLDGLYDPAGYLKRLQERCRGEGPEPGCYLVVEKILTGPERLREGWPIHGTTGYTFLNLVTGILVDRTHFRVMDRIYRAYSGRSIAYPDEVYDKKRLIMRISLASELQMLGHRLDRLSERHRRTRDFTLVSLTEALREVIAAFPVYRTYTADFEVHPADRAVIEHAVSVARRRNPTTNVTVYDFVRDTLLLRPLEGADEGYRQAQLEFVMKFQQFTGPVMAKAVEDTVFYTFHRLVSLNEVGGDPERFGIPLEAFHHRNAERAERWPYTMCATATHDTKRGEDLRARITVLSEIPREWQARLTRWRRLNRRRRQPVGERLAPSRNEEYLFYQTLVGAWPLTQLDAAAHQVVVDRLTSYLLKAVREAKINTSWINPDEPYERAIQRYVASVLDRVESAAFLADLEGFLAEIADAGLFAALSQAVLKLTCPGVPDLYQGTELWDFSLVDPDNRRPVDYAHRSALLADLEARCARPEADLRGLAAELVATRADGRLKLYLIWRALAARRRHPALQPGGGYRALSASGSRADHVCALARVAQDDHVVVIAPRWFTRLQGPDGLPFGAEVWEDTEVLLESIPAAPTYRNLFTGESVPGRTAHGRPAVELAAAIRTFPVAVLEPES
ncbi:MAG TPA: malto-oligosyltrehalose synthase [Methylomirabilota bacterium]|nr:malto-oligosyltrehalose synthase [Methylomirabilota bacterium]